LKMILAKMGAHVIDVANMRNGEYEHKEMHVLYVTKVFLF
jgi:hypothetical protein